MMLIHMQLSHHPCHCQGYEIVRTLFHALFANGKLLYASGLLLYPKFLFSALVFCASELSHFHHYHNVAQGSHFGKPAPALRVLVFLLELWLYFIICMCCLDFITYSTAVQ
jgi:hypothetical protein